MTQCLFCFITVVQTAACLQMSWNTFWFRIEIKIILEWCSQLTCILSLFRLKTLAEIFSQNPYSEPAILLGRLKLYNCCAEEQTLYQGQLFSWRHCAWHTKPIDCLIISLDMKGVQSFLKNLFVLWISRQLCYAKKCQDQVTSPLNLVVLTHPPISERERHTQIK